MTAEKFVGLLPMPAMVIANDRFITALNRAAQELLGADPAGRHYMTVLRQPDIIEQIETCLDKGCAAGAGKLRYSRQAAGRSQVFRVSSAPIEGAGAVLVVFEDITPFEEARRMRSDFVANVSHELRTPLTALQGFIETLAGPARDDPEARARFLEIMAREAERMNRLIGDLLSLSRVEDGEGQRPRDQVDLAALIGEQIAALEPAAARRGVRMHLAGPEQRLMVPGDADQLRQVFANLLENAIKYGREGGEVRVRVRARDMVAALGGPGLEVAVSDQGEGIAAHHIGRLTERFYRIDTHRSRNMGGTGLGLAIVKHIIRRHRGRLRIASIPGQGSTFTVLLPLQ